MRQNAQWREVAQIAGSARLRSWAPRWPRLPCRGILGSAVFELGFESKAFPPRLRKRTSSALRWHKTPDTAFPGVACPPDAKPAPPGAGWKHHEPKPANLAEEGRPVYTASWNRPVKTEIPVKLLTLRFIGKPGAQ